jgi:hypothetical protein
MEKKGIGTGLEQDWNLAKMAGVLALYAIPTGGTNKNMSARFNDRINLGGGQILTLDNDYQRNSYLSLPQTTNLSNRIGFNRSIEGMSTQLNIGRTSNSSQGFSSSSYTATVAQSFQFARTASASFNADYSQFQSGSTASSTRTEQLATRFQADQRGNNYTLQLIANKNIPMGNGQRVFGGVEKLPEFALSNFRFTNGFLARIPATFNLSLGKYMEGGSLGFGSTAGKIETERAVGGFDIQGYRLSLSKSTDMNLSGGFTQFFYGDGFAQYVIRDSTSLAQRWGHHSGVNLNYTYQRPEGGTRFRFDQQGQYHALNADMGVLDDPHYQLTARVGYDFAQQSFGGLPARPWQTLSVNSLLRPASWGQMRNLFSFDPNNGKMLSVTSDLRFRGGNAFALDVVSRYDPARKKMGNVNTYLDLPIGKLWRVLALMQYNGYLNRFESRNLQIIRDFHCLEAAITYIDNPFGFRSDREIMFQLRIKAIPIFNRFGAGQFGQAIDTSVGGIY